eukprot:381680_1
MQRCIQQNQGLKVLVLGFPRTGQTSMQRLLTKLGYINYNDGTILRNLRKQIPLWEQAVAGSDTFEWNDIFANHTAAIGLPTCLYWKQIIDYYPDCKVILLKRDTKIWYQSIFQTFGWCFPVIKLYMKIIPNSILYKKYYNLTHLHMIGLNFYNWNKNKQNAMNIYNEFNNDIINCFETNNIMDRLFIIDFDLSKQEKDELHSQLIAFLDISQDDDSNKTHDNAFPHKNRRYQFYLFYSAVFMYLIFYEMGYRLS